MSEKFNMFARNAEINIMNQISFRLRAEISPKFSIFRTNNLSR